MSPRPMRGRGIALAILAACLLAGAADAGLDAWTSNGPPNALILSVAVDPLTPSIVYAGSSGGGIFRSRDGGTSWTPVNAGLANPTVSALAVHPFGTGIVYAGTSGGGVFRSLDGGESWAPTGLVNGLITALSINPVVPTILYAGATGQGVFRSVNGGESWAPVNAGLTNFAVTALAINPLNPDVVYAGTTGNGVFRSLNAGGSWTATSNGLTNFAVTALAINPATPATLYAGTSGGGVFRSPNAGMSWAPVNTGLLNFNGNITSLVINPRLPDVLYASAPGTGVFRTGNAGSSWNLFNTGLINTLVNALAITPAGVCVHAGTSGAGVFDFALEPTGCAPVAVAAAVLPSSRSVTVNAAATAFATIVNPAPTPAFGCGIAMLGPVPASFSFQTTDPATNAVTGSPNVAADIGAQGLQTYVIAVTPFAPIAAADVRFNFGCTTSASAPIIVGVNTLLLSASPTPVADIVALAASDGGIVNVPGNTGTGVFAVATINAGAGETITASADTGGAVLPLTLAICETNAAGVCLAPAGPAPVTRGINPGDTPTFGIFVTGTAFIPYDPAARRVFVRFTDPGGQTRGSTSVAVRTQ